ncbi:MAG: GNAT family N-acetyltransferase [Chloroflexi bacterium]|nr:GNAT family N-acetyltransferase [Chloroflexota bacterium]
MTAATQIVNTLSPTKLRSFDMQRDLLSVADLIELCFANRLDADGRRYVRQMRSAARNARALGWAANAAHRISMPFSGFVWEEDGQLLGNLSLVSVTAMGKRTYLIANVAVHPDHRRRGIARALTDAALENIHRRGIEWSWLQVDNDNPAAINLYQSVGFEEQARRTTWHSDPAPESSRKKITGGIKITSRRPYDWEQQLAWLNKIYPPKVTWHLPYKQSLLRAGLGGAFNRLFSEKRIHQWSARRESELIGVLAWQSSFTQADRLWLASSRHDEEEAILALLPFVRMTLNTQRTLALNYPTGRATDALRQAGFHNHQTLIWMRRAV